MPPHYLPKTPSHEGIKMPARKGYSEQVGPDKINWGDVFCLPDHSLFICEVNHFFIWNDKDKKFYEVKIPDFDFPIDGYSYNRMTKVGNSNSIFVYDHISEDPEHSNRETVTSFLFEGNKKIREMPCMLYHPILLDDNNIIGIDDSNRLVKCIPCKRATPTITKFDKNKKITGFYPLRNNYFLVLDETNLLCLYQLSDNGFIQIKQKEAVKNIETIQDFDNDSFICSIYDNLGDKKNKIKDCKTKLELWDKNSLSCIQELEITGVLISNLKQLPNSNANILIGCDRYSFFIIDFNQNKVNVISLDCCSVDFSIADNGKLVILTSDKKRINHLIQIEPDLLYELINQPGQGVIHTHINNLRQAPVSLQPAIAEDKTVVGVKETSIRRPPTFFGSTGDNAIDTAHFTNNASTLPTEETKPRGYKNAST
jgi:hypothetical protein